MAKRGVALVVCLSTIWFACGSPSNPSSGEQRQTAADIQAPILLPTGALITPLEADGATFQALNPGLPTRPDFTAGQATSTALKPRRQTAAGFDDRLQPQLRPGRKGDPVRIQ